MFLGSPGYLVVEPYRYSVWGVAIQVGPRVLIGFRLLRPEEGRLLLGVLEDKNPHSLFGPIS